MNGLRASVCELEQIVQGTCAVTTIDLLLCPPATLLAEFSKAARNSVLAIGAQDCHSEPAGAFTGDISAEMLNDAGASAVIVGHSERRMQHRESDADVCAKALAARRAGLLAIVCVGETRAQREAGEAFTVVQQQLAGSLPDGSNDRTIAVAYEPVWAIGTGLTPSGSEIAEMHRFIRERLHSRFGQAADTIRILYGGSVKAANAKELFGISEVDGALVGGASLDGKEFLAIARACAERQ